MRKTTIISLLFIIVLTVVTSFYVANYQKTQSVADPKIEAFAQYLATKKVTMYGAEWCPHCKAQKALFGSAFKYIPYVECPENTKICLDKGINGYPTWITEDGKKFEGEQSLEKLAEISGYTLPLK